MNIVIIDDDPLVIASLKTILTANNVTVSACGSDGTEAEELFERYKPDILLMDIRMQKMSGIEAAEKILEQYKDAKILLLTTFNDEEFIMKAVKFGCKGYILKQNINLLLPTLHAVAAGSVVFDSEIITNLPVAKPERKSCKELNPRENDVLDLLADGLNNKEIAQRLSLSEGTVRNYISSILEKLNLRDRTQLLVYYYTK
ncbi:MAG: response regulator [Treponema sp.]